MKIWLAVLWVMVTLSPAFAETVTVVSPDHAQTWAFGRMTGSRFFWSAKAGVLYVDLTFDNGLYSGRHEPAAQEYFLFKLPGVEFDSASNHYFVRDNAGTQVVVAELKKVFLGSFIEPAAGTQVHVQKNSGWVSVVLMTYSSVPKNQTLRHWIEHWNDGFLQNLIR